MSTDPLLRATANGDTACPDGRALASLGRSVRDASALPRPVDLVSGVMSRLDATDMSADDSDVDDDAIDAFYDGAGQAPAELVNLSSLIRGAAQVPHSVDLVEGVRAQLNGSRRLSVQRPVDLSSRWRIWSTVVAGHVAALLALAIYQIHSNQPESAVEEHSNTVVTSSNNVGIKGQPGDRGLPKPPSRNGPASWPQIPGTTIDLFAPRRSESARTTARSASGMADTAPTVAAGLRWVLVHQDPVTGRFGSASIGDHAVAVHSLALLALLGEGLDDPQRATAASRGLSWLIEQQRAVPVRDTATTGLSLLALVEGALLSNDPQVRVNAESALATAESGIPEQSGPAGLGGFLLLAYETASQGGLAVPASALESVRRTLGRSLPDIEEDTGRLGIAVFARLISGRTENASTPLLLEELGRMHRIPRVDPSGRIDPLGWYFASLAAHEADGALWIKWSDALRQTVQSAMITEGDQAHLPAARARFAEAMADGAMFATSAALLELQVPYRYLPVAR